MCNKKMNKKRSLATHTHTQNNTLTPKSFFHPPSLSRFIKTFIFLLVSDKILSYFVSDSVSFLFKSFTFIPVVYSYSSF